MKTITYKNWKFDPNEMEFDFTVAEIIEHKEIKGDEICKTCNNN